MRKLITAGLSGVLFALGLLISGMTRPANVIGFLDFAGDWNPSLLFVMGGAVLVHAPLLAWTRRRTRPLFAPSFAIPTRRDIDPPLVLGAVLFGIGWGLYGYCPGPAWVALGSVDRSAVTFVAAMLAGMYLFSRYQAFKAARSSGTVRTDSAPPLSP